MVTHVLPLHTGRAFFSTDWDGALFAWLAYTADDQEGSYDKNLFGGRFFGFMGSYMAAPRLADRGITSVALAESGERFAVGSDEGFVEIWAVRGLEMFTKYQAHSGRVISVSLNDSGSRVASLGRDGKIVVAELVADPGFGISPASFRYKVLPLLTEEMKSARKLHFLSSGNLLLTTAEGQVGELSLANAKATPPPTPTPQKNAPVTATDSDY
jgi:WD40 repeat protein